MGSNIRIKPTLGRVAVRLETTEGVSKGGIILPMGKQEITTVGVVVELCEPYSDESGNKVGPMFHLGDRVVFGKYSGVEIQINRDKFVIMKETDVLATMFELPSTDIDESSTDGNGGKVVGLWDKRRE